MTGSDDDEADDASLSEAWKAMCGDWDFNDKEVEPCEEMSFSRLLADIHCGEDVEERKQKAQD